MKRFTDVTKWTKNKWFRKLPIHLKIFWLYLLDNCDNVGVWEEDVELASILINYEYNCDDLLEVFKDKIKIFRDGKKWWIKDFIIFQYGELKEDHLTNKPHQSYIRLLKNHRLWIDYKKTLQSLKEKDKDKDMDKEKEISNKFDKFWGLYDKKVGDKKKVLKKFSKLSDDDIELIMEYIPKYNKAKPDKQFRKDPTTFLNNKSWLDEIIEHKPKQSYDPKQSISA